ncbi:unnamed protein product, partial [Rotaria socialis]
MQQMNVANNILNGIPVAPPLAIFNQTTINQQRTTINQQETIISQQQT